MTFDDACDTFVAQIGPRIEALAHDPVPTLVAANGTAIRLQAPGAFRQIIHLVAQMRLKPGENAAFGMIFPGLIDAILDQAPLTEGDYDRIFDLEAGDMNIGCIFVVGRDDSDNINLRPYFVQFAAAQIIPIDDDKSEMLRETFKLLMTKIAKHISAAS